MILKRILLSYGFQDRLTGCMNCQCLKFDTFLRFAKISTPIRTQLVTENVMQENRITDFPDLRPNHPPSRKNLGITLEKDGRFDEAAAAFARTSVRNSHRHGASRFTH